MEHRRGCARRDDESGFTLVEMMVAILVLGVVLSALAATLMASIRATVGNERETRATAYGQQELEVLQAIDWDVAALYEDEISAAPAAWSARLEAPGRYDGLDLITLPAPPSAAARGADVPLPSDTITDGGVTYTVDRYITWVDRTEDGTVDTRRFTVVVSWDDRSTDRQITVTAERAPSQGDITATAAGARVLQLSLSPNPAPLADDQTLTEDVRVRVILNQASVGATQLYYHALLADDVTWELRHVDPTPDATFTGGAPPNTRFTFVIPAGTRMVAASQDTLFVGRDINGSPIEAFGALELTGGALTGETPQPVPPSSSGPTYPNPPAPAPSEEPTEEPSEGETPPGTAVAVMPNTTADARLCVDHGSGKLNQPFTLTIGTKGLTQTDGTVTVSYLHGKKGDTEASDGAVWSGGTASSATFVHTIAAASRTFDAGTNVTFTIDARRQSDGDNDDDFVTVPVVVC